MKTQQKGKLLHYQTKAHTLFHHLLGEEIDLLLLLLGFHPLEERHKKELLVALVTYSNALLLFARHGWLELDGRLDGSIPRLEETITHTP